jgi:hypothetical protein
MGDLRRAGPWPIAAIEMPKLVVDVFGLETDLQPMS